MTLDDHEWLERARHCLQQPLPVKKRAELSYALGKYHTDIADYANAFHYYQQANQAKQLFTPAYDPANQEKILAFLTTHYTRAVCHQSWPGCVDSKRPLLIVGMPRSGTSLTEQILASHPDVVGAGELSDWSTLAERHKQAVLRAQLDPALVQSLADHYLDTLHQFDQTALRVIDKMPGNYQNLGLIHAVLPNAKFIHTLRNPLDTCLSIYFQNFNTGHTYAKDLDDIAHYYRQYHRLMEHWRQVLPEDAMLEVRYEELVEDPETWSRRLIDFIGLEWDDNCLNFHQTERRVGTASNWQVRQPIYKTSKDRWRNYEPWIGPLLPLLELYSPMGDEMSR
ncbi:sulfotransferase [Magnetovirga frankeli]|uniref:sulfotransferase family protein n=1 Tax=Magnetovirga frankeli TaxID=947516 RepID=UPI001AF97AA6|nr:sulfotransferase [gamma proteobacterium SS-5]